MSQLDTEIQAAVPSPAPEKPTCSEARLRANRLNAQNSSGPKSVEGKKRSCLNATRHGILSQTVHFPEEEMKAYTEFCDRYVADLKPVGALETELANACADLQRKAPGTVRSRFSGTQQRRARFALT